LTLYSRAHCGLCEDMERVLQEAAARGAIALQIVDVDADPRLAARYGTEVPVLLHGSREICRHRLEPAALDAFLANIG
jgi:glutaredoxin